MTKWIAGMRAAHVAVALPRFKMTTGFSLKESLSALGMTDAFLEDKARFTGIRKENDLFISDVIHKAFVDVNEEGTEAAAATAVIAKTGAPSAPEEFNADRPFIFLIRDLRTGGILFIGRMMDPR
jgi:serpin B